MYNGVLNIYKPKGFTSHDVVSKLRGITGMKKIGHTGTLDPMAEGVLPLCLGKATRIAQYLTDGDKEYLATIKLGQETDSLDAEGTIIKECPVPNLSEEKIIEALLKYTGAIKQKAPIYSAIKKDGKALYKYARSGQEVQAPVRDIFIYKNDFLSYDAKEKVLQIKTLCSKGTYIRSLARDLGQELGTCAHLTGLLRTKSSAFLLENAVSLERLEEEGLFKYLTSMEEALLDFPLLELNEADSHSFALGRQLVLPEELAKIYPLGKEIKVLSLDKEFIGLGQIEKGLLKPKKIFIENKPKVICLGNFDGVHKGHQELIRKTVKLAKENNYASQVISFYPHPRSFFNENIQYINSLAEKNRLVSKLGADSLELLSFNQELSSLSAEDFIKDIIYKKLKTRILVVGYDFFFGKNRQGNPEFLKEKASQYGIEVYIIPPVKVAGQLVSSTLIKEELQAGRIKEANELLGYNYQLSARVITGKQIGREIGFPTANLDYHKDKLLPGRGVYAVKVSYKRQEYFGLANIGIKPTVKKDSSLEVEVHLLNFEGDLYGQTLQVEFLDKIRDEKKFSSLEELKEQIKIDRGQIKKYN